MLWQVEVNEGVVTVLKKGSYFGEIGLLRTCRRTASVRAISETVDLFVLSKVCIDAFVLIGKMEACRNSPMCSTGMIE